jgi:hypothetical protein
MIRLNDVGMFAAAAGGSRRFCDAKISRELAQRQIVKHLHIEADDDGGDHGGNDRQP